MSNLRRTILLLVILIQIAAGCAPDKQPTSQPAVAAEWSALPADVDERFARADQPRSFTFPADHGAHTDFQTEWWYFTGNLADAAGRRFGYELTFFRRALTPLETGRESAWATSQIYMAHFALTDADGKQFYARQRFSRSGLDLAGATTQPYVRIWLQDWQVVQKDSQNWELSASDDDFSIIFKLSDQMGPVLQGESGLSRKGPGNASYYYSLPDLNTSGTITAGGKTYTVSGSSWMDHEFSTSALASDQVGWDWFALQLEDGRRLMLFTLRKSDGSVDPYSSATLIQPDGSTTVLGVEDFTVSVENQWSSPTSGAQYPSAWRVQIPSQRLDLQIEPVLADQELNLAFIYWEGAVDVRGSVTGRGYVELTGYAQSMQGEF